MSSAHFYWYTTEKIKALYFHLLELIYDAMPTLLTSIAEVIHSRITKKSFVKPHYIIEINHKCIKILFK